MEKIRRGGSWCGLGGSCGTPPPCPPPVFRHLTVTNAERAESLMQVRSCRPTYRYGVASRGRHGELLCLWQRTPPPPPPTYPNHPPQRGRKPLSLLSGTFSAIAADLVSHRISGRPSANKVNARPKGNWCFQLEDKSEVKDGATLGGGGGVVGWGGGNWEESQ